MAEKGSMGDPKASLSLRTPEQLVSRSRRLSQRVATFQQRVANEGDALAEEVKQLQTDLKRALDETGDGDGVEELLRAKATLQGHGPGGDLRKLNKQKLPALLRLLLGSRISVVTTRRNEAIKLKEEYHSFRDRGGVYLFILAALLLFGLRRADMVQGRPGAYTLTPPFMVGVQLFLCWLLYMYTALALRENVLKVNGSSIRDWWIHHHYWAIGTCLIILTLPVDSTAYQEFLRSFLWWSAYQGLVIIMQNKYQRKRMYTRIALGKNRAMDVVSGESSGESGQLLIIYPMLLGLQSLQAGIGVQMVGHSGLSFLSPEGWLDFERHESDLRGSRGVTVVGCLMLYMAISNFWNTALTIWQKARLHKKLPPQGPPSIQAEAPQKPKAPQIDKEETAEAQDVSDEPKSPHVQHDIGDSGLWTTTFIGEARSDIQDTPVLSKKYPGTGMQGGHLLLTSQELHDALTSVVLPLLDVRALAALACTCSKLRSIAYGHKDLWRSSVKACLPLEHPSIADLDLPELQSLMQQRTKASNGIASGHSGVRLDLAKCEGQVQRLLFSSCGKFVAVITTQQIAVTRWPTTLWILRQ
ncbi:hypothetical protein WJX73_001107 [Symbiochloris irregularis]|uniref:F-box domain-containing protein n=1 Tax=Symbiochloris irregularis TaxID=706552 RepID=A0AAW1NXG5_9CHLO